MGDGTGLLGIARSDGRAQFRGEAPGQRGRLQAGFC